MIGRDELWMMINIAWTDDELLARIEELVGAIESDLLRFESDGDVAVAVHCTDAGTKALAGVMLPWTVA